MKKKDISIIVGCVALAAVIGGTTISAKSNENELSVNVPNAGIASVLENCSTESSEQKAELSALITRTVMASSGDASGEGENIEDKNDNQEPSSGDEAKVTSSEDTTDETKDEATAETGTVAETQAETTNQPETTTQPATEAATEEPTTEETTTEETTTEEPSFYDTIAMSQVDNYVNVRSMPSTDGEIVGKIYNNCAATIVETVGEWYKIESGNVQGYIKAEYFVTGDEAEAVALQCRNVFATVTTEVLNVRAGQGTDTELLTQLPYGGEFDVIEYGDGWVYLDVDGDVQGWVSMDYVDISVHFDTAITLEEEQAKIAEEERLAREAEEAARIAEEARRAEEAAAAERARQEAEAQQAQQQAAAQEAQQVYEATAAESDSASALRNAVVAYALQFVGNPYVYGGTSLTNGTDCSGFTLSVYANFGYSLNRVSGDQASNGVAVSLDSLLPGDLLFYSNGGSGIGHVALYIGNGQVVHASTPATGIKISDYMYRTPITARRIIN